MCAHPQYRVVLAIIRSDNKVTAYAIIRHPWAASPSYHCLSGGALPRLGLGRSRDFGEMDPEFQLIGDNACSVGATNSIYPTETYCQSTHGYTRWPIQQ
jgi:hypothetical protein